MKSAPASSNAPAAGPNCSTPSTKFDSGTGWPSFWDTTARRGEDHGRQQPRHGAHRIPLRQMRRTSGPRLQRRPGADRPALLHEWLRIGLQARGQRLGKRSHSICFGRSRSRGRSWLRARFQTGREVAARRNKKRRGRATAALACREIQNMSRDLAAAVASASRKPSPSGPSSAFSAALPRPAILALYFETKPDWSLRKLFEAA